MDCEHCGYFFQPGTSEPQVVKGCPNCGRPYRDQPNPTNSDMAIRDMPQPGMDDMGGNPLMEGILADSGWRPLNKRDESFASVKESHNLWWNPGKWGRGLIDPTGKVHTWPEEEMEHNQRAYALGYSPAQCRHFGIDPHGNTYATGDNYDSVHGDETLNQARQVDPRLSTRDLQGLMWHEGERIEVPMETTEVMEPPRKVIEAPHRVTIQIPNGITDNLHQALRHTNAWVENPYENGHLRPYNKYWQAVRNKLIRQMRIGVSDPHHAEIINHVAQTDDPSPLQTMKNSTKIAGPAAALIPAALGGAEVGGLMGGALGAGRAFMGVKGLAGMAGLGGGGGEQGGASTPPQGVPYQDSSYYAAAGDDYESPSSVSERNDTEDPEKVDPNEKNDGDNKDWQKDFSVNDIGGTTQQPGFAPDSPAIQRLHSLLPLVLHYCDSDESGAHDPLLKGLHEALEGELPGYLDQGDPQKAHSLIMMIQKGDKGDHKEKELTASHNNQMDHTSADHQGPHTPEQLAAVAQLLNDAGRHDEVPEMIMAPQNYADELAQVQNKPDEPPSGDLTAAPPEPPVEQTPPNAGMPMPGMSGPQAQSMMTAAIKHGADHIAEQCPKCGSHTTKLLDGEDGSSRCHNCGADFKTNVTPAASDSTSFSKGGAAEQGPPGGDGDPEGAGNHTWQDQNGQPLQVGQQYEVYSDKYEIPDIVQITAVKPNSVEWMLTGEHGLNAKQDISHQESLLEGLSFKPFGSDGPDQVPDSPQGIETNDDAVNQTQPGFEQSDMSTPHMMTGSTTASRVDEGVDHNDPALEWLNPRTAGAHYSPMEQREFIEEAGVARNSDKLNLSGTHYESAIEDSFLFGI